MRNQFANAMRPALLLASAALACGCETMLKAPDAEFAAGVQFERYVKSSEPRSGARFGLTLALDETSLVASGPFEAAPRADGEGEAEEAGALYAFDLQHGLRPSQRLTASNPDPQDATFSGTLLPPGAGNNVRWGATIVALDSDWIALGLPGEDSALVPSDEISAEEAQADNGAPEAGAVYVYRRSQLTDPPIYIKAPNPDPGDLFGMSVALWDGWLAVGAVGEASSNADDDAGNDAPQSGAVYLYRYDAERDDFTFHRYLKAPNPRSGDLFGNAISIEADLMVVAAWMEDGGGKGADADDTDISAQNAGAVFAYRWTGEQWVFDAYIKASAPDPGGGFGAAVRILDGHIVVGEPFGLRCPGAEPVPVLGVVYVIGRKGNEWSEYQCLNPAGRAPGGLFAYSLGGYGNRLVVGAPWDPPKQAGAAYAFERDDSGIWQERARIVAPNRDEGDGFGGAIGVNSTTVAIGAFGEAGAETGSSADLLNDDAPESGAVYLFQW